ncbi:TonB-dependent vitamin B12 receptor [Salinisphaera aquimarina]|uniref:TonB-dependent vitamin B12 receptor n=1 Tax=Salinisphaera aquimarina TaxID=2094031 RepID=A0ABV7EM19_9GAMM
MKFFVFTGALLSSASFGLHAAPIDAASPQGLDGIVVTATRTPLARSNTLAATTVITREQIERTQARSVTELLARAPGIDVASSGGPGKLTSIFMRGTESDHVLVLVDGVRYGSATSGIPAIQDLPVGQIERIEIVRGPRSSLYGSDAIGGVIQIFTRDGSNVAGSGPQPYFSAGAGTYHSYDGQAGVSGRTERGHYNLSISGENTDGFDSCSGRPFGAPGGGAGCFADQADEDGYARAAGSFNGGYRFDNGLTVNGHYLRADADNEYDGTTANQSDIIQEVYGVSLAGRLADPWTTTLELGRSRDSTDDTLNGTFASDFETVRDTVSLQNDIVLDAHNTVVLGLDYRREEVASSLVFEQTKRDNKGVFGQYLGDYGRHHVQFAARGDDNEQFGEHATGSATYGFDLSDVYTATASFGTAFKAPTFNELYYPSFPGFAPSSNPDLDPEESKSYELGLQATPDWGQWSLHAYETRVDDLVALDAVFTPQNISETRLRGVEGDIATQLGAWTISANANWLDAENRADGPNRGNDLPRRPGYSAQLDVDRALGAFSAGASLFAAGSRYDDLANTRRLDSYQLVDLRGGVEFAPDWLAQVRLSNLFDEDYETVAFYNQPGRSVYLTLRYQP